MPVRTMTDPPVRAVWRTPRSTIRATAAPMMAWAGAAAVVIRSRPQAVTVHSLGLHSRAASLHVGVGGSEFLTGFADPPHETGLDSPYVVSPHRFRRPAQ